MVSAVIAVSMPGMRQSSEKNIALLEQIERVEAVLEQLGTVHDRSFVRREKTDFYRAWHQRMSLRRHISC